MEFFRSKIQTIQNKLAEKELDDPRLLGVVLLGVIGLAVVYNGAKVVQQNYELTEKIAILEEENRVLDLQNQNRELEIEYYKTPEFAELKARRVNGVASAGEKVYTIDKETALAALKTPQESEENTENSNKPTYQKNFEAWMNFFFGS